MTIRAAIYIRVSTELQAEKASPQIQETECRDHCSVRGYVVTRVYRDINKYRVGKRLIEPSGTRADRPGFREMLSDAAAGHFEVIVAWREDRLYRGIRPMIDILELLERHSLTIELAKESFDRRMAPIKASIAKMELDGMKQRYAMGRAAKLMQGQVHPGTLPYGYKPGKDRHTESNELEAPWVRLIFQLYADGATVNEIRRQLIARNAPQREATTYHRGAHKVHWAKGVIQKILTNEVYSTGNRPTKSGGQLYNVSMPIPIDRPTANRAHARRLVCKKQPLSHVKYDYLAEGLLYCAHCQVKASTKTRLRKNAPSRIYVCPYYDQGYNEGGRGECFGSAGVLRTDADLWVKVWEVVSDEAAFEQRIQAAIDAIRPVVVNTADVVQRIERQLDDLVLQEQVVITKWRMGGISEAAMDRQIASINIERASYQNELTEKSPLTDNRVENLIAFANAYRGRLGKAERFLNYRHTAPEMIKKQYLVRREIVTAVVTRVEVRADKTLQVHFLFDYAAAAGEGISVNTGWREFIGGSILEQFELWGTPDSS